MRRRSRQKRTAVGAATRENSIQNGKFTLVDFFPTIADVVGSHHAPRDEAKLRHTERDGYDGESLMPLLKQTGSLKRSAIYFHYPNFAFHGDNRLGSAIRQGKYKLIERFDDGSLELYNLKVDIGEKNNLAKKMPDQASDLKGKLSAWRKETGAAMPSRR